MHPPRLRISLLLALVIVLAGALPASAQQGQRRVFTNEDFPKAAPPPAPPAPAETPAPSAEATPGAEAAPSGFEDPKEDPNLPPGLSLSNSLQGALRRFHAEFATMLEQETDPVRQERLKTMMNLSMQLLTHNQLFIADLKAQQEQQQQAEAQSGAQPAP